MGLDQAAFGEWAIGLYRGKTLDTLVPYGDRNPIIRGNDFRDINGSAVADPFAIRHKDAWYVFFELFFKGTDQAVIGCSRSPNLADWKPQGIVLKQPHHLSYPFVFEHEGEIYMMPESKSVKRVDIYRAVDFPKKWVFEKTILRGRYMDCSMVYHQGRYWIFAGWRSYWLRLFHSPNPLGPWTAHWMPSIRRYSRSSTRPGGRPVVINHQLVRFSQDNTLYYGQQLRAWNVTTMNRWWYAEKPLFAEPIMKGTGTGWNSRCMHHIDPFVVPASRLGADGDPELLAFVDGCA